MMAGSDGAVLVVGAGGFIGRHVAQAIAARTPQRSLIRLVRGALPADAPGEYLSLEIGDATVLPLTELLRRHAVRAVVNCAGTTRASEEAQAADNVGATAALLAAIAAYDATTVFCQLGSGAEYEMLPAPARTGEDTAANPAGAYGQSKLAATEAVLAATAEERVRGYVLRLFNPIGVGMPSTQLLGKVLEYLRSPASEPLQLGSLDSYRDYIDVRDVAAAIAVSLERAGNIRGEVVNIGTGNAQSTRTLIEQLFDNANRQFTEDRAGGSARSKWANWQEADIGKARRLLGWEPRYSIDDTLAHLAASVQGA